MMECYITIKKNESLPFATILMDLEGIMLSEISQTEKFLAFKKQCVKDQPTVNKEQHRQELHVYKQAH